MNGSLTSEMRMAIGPVEPAGREKARAQRPPGRWSQGLVHYAIAVLGLAVATGIRALLDPILGLEYPFLTYLIVIVLLAAWTDLQTGLVATLLGAILGVTFFTEPRGSIELRSFSDQIGTGLYLFVGVVVSYLSHAQRQARVRAQARQRELETALAELARAQGEVHQSEQSFRQLADSMPQIVWITRPDGFHEYFNRRWYDFIGINPEDTLGHGWQLPLHPDDRDRAHARWKASLESGDPYEIEYRFLGKDGQYRWFLGRALPIRDAFGRITRWFGTCTDIDDQKRAQEVLLRSREELEAMVHERTAALEATNSALELSNRELQEFASVASHDLQEPLRKIQAFGDRLRQRCDEALGEQGRDYLGRMQMAASRMSSLINDLLAFSRVTTKAQPFQPVDLQQVAREVLLDLEVRVQQAEAEVEVCDLPTIDADPLQMRQLLQNLIGNALKFCRPDAPPRLRITATLVGPNHQDDPDPGPPPPGPESCILKVADNGIGFDEKYLDRIFNVFQRLHGRDIYEGTGMGLAICRKIAERHGGSITATSEPGKGSTFIVTLPARHQEG